MISERLLLDDGEVVVSEVRCPGAWGEAGADSHAEEVVPLAEVCIPLRGTYVRTARRAGSPAAPWSAIGDPGRALVFRPGEPYRVEHPIPGADRSLVIALRSPAPDLETLGVHDRPVPHAVTIGARALARDLIAGHADPLAASEQAIGLVQAIGRDRSPGARAVAGSERRLAASVRLEIAARVGERKTLAELGRRAGVSGWELARRFRRATGTSVHAYRTRLRVQAALERIEDGERDLTGLALDLGFADHSHMTNVVRRATGYPPSAFRLPIAAWRQRTILQA